MTSLVVIIWISVFAAITNNTYPKLGFATIFYFLLQLSCIVGALIEAGDLVSKTKPTRLNTSIRIQITVLFIIYILLIITRLVVRHFRIEPLENLF